MTKLILPRRKFIKSAVAALITSPAIIRRAEAQLSMSGVGGAFGAGAAASMAFDAKASAYAAGGTTTEWDHPGAANVSAVAIIVGEYQAASTVSGVTYGGISMGASVVSRLVGVFGCLIFGLASPPTGTQHVIVTYSGVTNYCGCGSISVTGSDPATCFSNSNGATGSSTTPSVTVTSAVGEIVVDGVDLSGPLPITEDVGQLNAWKEGAASLPFTVGSTKVGASSVTMGWTAATNYQWAHVAASFKKL